jgi:hypothetical protein
MWVDVGELGTPRSGTLVLFIDKFLERGVAIFSYPVSYGKGS